MSSSGMAWAEPLTVADDFSPAVEIVVKQTALRALIVAAFAYLAVPATVYAQTDEIGGATAASPHPVRST